MFDNDMLASLATQRGLTLDQLLANRQRVDAMRDAAPDVEYRNGVLYQDGQQATPEQVQAFAKTNPYVPENWLATAADRGGLTPGVMPGLMTEGSENSTMDRQNEMLSKQTDFFGRPLGPVVRSEKLPAKGVEVSQVSVKAIPAGKVSVPYNSVAGVKPLLNSVLGSLGGPVSRTAKPRTTK